MADFVWPADLVPYAVTYYLQSHSGGSESPFSRQTKVYELSAPRWVCRMSFRGGYNYEWTGDAGDYGPRLDAFIAKLKGRANRVAISDFRRPPTAGALTNAAIDVGDTQVTLSGATAPRVGEYLTGDGRPHIITEVAGAGPYIVSVEPPFGAAVSSGTSAYQTAYGTFRLTSDDAGANPSEVGSLATYDLEFVEDVGGAEFSQTVEITGTPRIGETLTVLGGDWTSYQWLADGVAIPGATSSTFLLTTSENNAMISVSVGLAIGGSATSGTVGPVAPFSAMAADGWQATVASPTDLSMLEVTATRQGYDSTGTATTLSDVLYLTKRVRQKYPNQTSFTTDKVALSDYLLSTDTVAGATNSSTLVSPKPIAAWFMPSRLVVGNTIHWEIAAFHYFGRPDPSGGVGKQVACVRVRASDGTNNTAWQTVTAPTLSTTVEDAQPLYVYQNDLDVSGLNDNATIRLEAEVYPWVGTAASVLKSEDNFSAGASNRTFTRRYFTRNTTRAAAPQYAYVSSTGVDASGVISSTAATAEATPFLTVKGVIEKARTTLGTSLGAFDGLRIRIVDTVNFGASATFNTYGWGEAAIVIERAPSTARAAAIITINAFAAMTNISGIPTGESSFLFNDVTVKVGGSFLLQGTAGTQLLQQLWNVNIDYNSTTVTWRSNSHLAFFGAVCSNYASGGLSQTASGEIRCLRGVIVDLNDTGYEGWVTAGCRITRSGGPSRTNAAVDGHIWYGNSFPNPNTAAPIAFAGSVSGGDLGSVAIVQNLSERTRTGSGLLISLSADTAFGNITHAVVLHNTGTGVEDIGRINIAYDDHATVARTHKFIRFVGNLAPQVNLKADVRAGEVGITNPELRIGGFALHHGVGSMGNFFRNYDAAATNKITGPGSLSFGLLYGGIDTVIGGGDPLFTDNQSVTGTTASPVAGSGGGTYTLQSGSPAKNLLDFPLLARDLAGNARGTGAQNAGAYA